MLDRAIVFARVRLQKDDGPGSTRPSTLVSVLNGGSGNQAFKATAEGLEFKPQPFCEVRSLLTPLNGPPVDRPRTEAAAAFEDFEDRGSDKTFEATDAAWRDGVLLTPRVDRRLDAAATDFDCCLSQSSCDGVNGLETTKVLTFELGKAVEAMAEPGFPELFEGVAMAFSVRRLLLRVVSSPPTTTDCWLECYLMSKEDRSPTFAPEDRLFSQPAPYKFNSAGSPPWAEMLFEIAFSDA